MKYNIIYNRMELCNQYLYDLIKINPTYNDFFSKVYTITDNQPNIFTQRYINKENNIIEQYYKLVKHKKQKTFCDKLLFHELSSYVDDTNNFDSDLLPLNYSDNIICTFILQLSGNDTYYFKEDTDYTDFMNRLSMIPTLTKKIIYNMNEGISKQIVQPSIIVISLIKYFEIILSKKLYENLKIPKKYKQQFINSVELNLMNSIRELNDFLKNKYIHHSRNSLGLSKLKYGKQYYIQLVKYNTCKSMNIKKLLSKAHISLQSTLKHINNCKRKLKFKGNYQEFKYYITNNKKFKVPNKSNLLKELYRIQKDIINTIMPVKFYDIQTNINYKIICENKNDTVLSPYYVQLFKNSKGTMNINDKMIPSLNKNELYILSLHEGNPGHNYEQIMNNNVNDYVLFNNYVCYSEGWAFYVEDFYQGDNLYYILYKYIYELYRIIRLIVDIGIHYYNWSYETSFNFMKQYLFMSDESIHNDILRYTSDPAQALSYYIGRDIILYYKELFLQQNKNIKDFHKLFFDIGPCPMDIFINEMHRLGFSKYK